MATEPSGYHVAVAVRPAEPLDAARCGHSAEAPPEDDYPVDVMEVAVEFPADGPAPQAASAESLAGATFAVAVFA